jgi:PAS domain S-box-containing protein
MGFYSLKTKMTAAVFLLVLSLSFAEAGISIYYFEKNLKENISNQQFALLSSMARNIDNKLFLAHNALKATNSLITPDIIATPDKAQRFLDGQVGLHSIFDNGLFLFSSDGKVIAESPNVPGRRGRDISFREYYKDTVTTGKPHISEPYISTHSPGKPAIILTVPLFDQQGNLAAILAGGFDLLGENILQDLLTTKIGASGYMYLSDSNRTLIIHPDKRRIMTQASPVGTNKLFDRAQAGFEGSGETINSYGVAMLATFKRLRATNWILTANYPLTEAYAPIYRARGYYLVGAIVAALFSALLVWGVMKLLTAPLLGFTRHILDASSRGGEQKTVPITSRDEIGTLAQAFNTMLSELNDQKKDLSRQVRFLEILMETMPIPIYYRDAQGRFLGCNSALEAFLGLSREEIVGKSVYDFAPKDLADQYHRADAELLARQGTQIYESAVVANDGKRHDVVFYKSTFPTVDGTLGGVVGTILDITERKSLEAQLRQSQKFEAIGTLAGGIAHDFNNILTAIVGYATLLQMKMGAENPQLQHLERILAASERGANLTKSLLAYSRKQISNPEPIELNAVVAGVENLLRRLIPESVVSTISLSAEPLRVLADSGQIEQVLMNLVGNSRDAMPGGGEVSIRTGKFTMTQGFVTTHGYGKAGDYALLAVSDTGTGMDEETRERIFEPFFTTKDTGKGTGLGLAMVYGIVKQHGGFINVDSQLGVGTAFTIYLPLITTHATVKENLSPKIIPLHGGGETILLVEDDGEVRQLLKEVLESHEYKVIEAENGAEGIERFREHQNEIHILLTDVMMPVKNGRETYDEIKSIKSDVKAIFMSGYSASLTQGLLSEELHYLAKPVSPHDLIAKIQEVLSK